MPCVLTALAVAISIALSLGKAIDYSANPTYQNIESGQFHANALIFN